jgi:hypothetical protein
MPQLHDRLSSTILEVFLQEGVENGMASITELILNEAMKVQWSRHLEAAPYERTETRQDYAKGYKLDWD